jgi:CheY-like chemotaxis protein
MGMRRVRLVHWNEEEARERAAILTAAGYEVSCQVPAGPELLRQLKSDPPAALIIDLSRLPSQGRDLGLYVRKNGATRRIPLLFAGGDDSAVARIRQVLPDAACASWSQIRRALKRAIAHPPVRPSVPDSVFASYSGTPLPKKLGIKSGAAVGLVEAPETFARTLGPLPPGAELRAAAKGRCDLPVWFAWPKKVSGVSTDLSERIVREVGLAAGLVDYKICAIYNTWS